MLKMRKQILFLVSAFILLSIVGAQSTNPWSTGSGGYEKNSFITSDKVYAKSNSLCEPATEINLYVTEDKEVWQGGETLEDARGTFQTIILVNSKISLTEIWANPAVGFYDIVVDCNKNGVYDLYIDKIDNFDGVGFEIKAVTGIGSIKKGANDIGNYVWQYDPENINLLTEMLQFSLLAQKEDIEINNISLSLEGKGISAVEVYFDENNNRKVDSEEIMIGGFEMSFSENKSISLDIDYTLTKDVEENFLIVYTLNESIIPGNLSLKLTSLYGAGTASSKLIKFSGIPISSGVLTILPAKTCTGEVKLTLEPNPVLINSKVNADITGLNNCDNKTVFLRKTSCASKDSTNCTIKNNECQISFTASKSEALYACADKNDDKDFIDLGEYSTVNLVVNTTKIIETNLTENVTENITEENETEEETNETTGEVVKLEESNSLLENNSFLILLEVTLVLILFVLLMILFRLKPARSEKTE